MPTQAKVGAFEDEERANRTVRWLRRTGLHARMEQVGEAFEVVVPSGREEQEARRVLQALERTRERTELAEPTGWDRVRLRLLNLESVGTVVAVVIGAALLLFAGLGLWGLAAMVGWVGLIVVCVAGLVFVHFSGIPHSAVKSPRRWSGKHDITMEAEQEVQYRLAWAREQYRKSRRSPFRRRHPKE